MVITGRGAVSPYGLGVPALIDGVWRGENRVSVIEEWKTIKGFTSFLAAPVPEFNAKKLLPRSARRTMGKMGIYAALAAQEAVVDAGLSTETVQSGSLGIAMGSTTGSPESYEELHREFFDNHSIETIRSGLFFKIMGHSCAANVAHFLGIKGEQWSPVSACTSAAQALGIGYLLVSSGRQDAVICGGADEVHHSVTMVFDILGAASRRDNGDVSATPRPFDRDRDGVVCGGGAGALVLESYEAAKKRDAKIYCEISGFGHATDTNHIANPDSNSMAATMDMALAESGVKKEEIDYVNAHATGTRQGDIAEAEAICSALGSTVPVSSLKGHFGHTLGAAGALESIVVLEMMQRNEIIPTLNLDNPDKSCAQANLIQQIQSQKVETVLKNNFALGGVNAALLYRKIAL